jgi:hypothetical protein
MSLPPIPKPTCRTEFIVLIQIRLCPNGDFVTRSNEVETVCRRVNPDDWDDDGIHNERDANPTSYDGESWNLELLIVKAEVKACFAREPVYSSRVRVRVLRKR